MKKEMVFKIRFFFILIISAMLIGCENLIPGVDDPIDPPVVPTYHVTASVVGEGGTIIPNDTFVSQGSDLTVTFTPSIGYTSEDSTIRINGISFPLEGNSYTIRNICDSVKIEVSPVKDPLYPWAMMDKEWYLDSLYNQRIDPNYDRYLEWDKYLILGNPNERQEMVIFGLDGIVKNYWNGDWVFDTQYSIKQYSIIEQCDISACSFSKILFVSPNKLKIGITTDGANINLPITGIIVFKSF